MIEILLNGEPHRVAEGSSIADLLTAQGLAGKRLAVEHNEAIAPRSLHNTTVLQAGDRVEIVHAIGGG